jgi:hypothetical protein
MNLGRIMIDLDSLLEAKMVRSCFSGLVHNPPKIVPMMETCNSVSEGSKERKEMPAFFEIVSKESMNVVETASVFLILDKAKFDAFL